MTEADWEVGRKVEKRGRWLLGLLALASALNLMAIGAGGYQYGLFARLSANEEVSDREATINDAIYSGLGFAQGGASLLTAVAWLLWQSTSYRRLLGVGERATRFTPGWAIGYWFIPFANLYRPYQAIKDLWLRSEGGNTRSIGEAARAPALLGLWWALWLLSNLLGRWLLAEALGAESLEELQATTLFALVTDFVSVLSAAAAILVVRGILDRQAAWAPVPVS